MFISCRQKSAPRWSASAIRRVVDRIYSATAAGQPPTYADLFVAQIFLINRYVQPEQRESAAQTAQALRLEKVMESAIANFLRASPNTP